MEIKAAKVVFTKRNSTQLNITSGGDGYETVKKLQDLSINIKQRELVLDDHSVRSSIEKSNQKIIKYLSPKSK